MVFLPRSHRQFLLDLQAWIEWLINKGHSIILSLDNNEDLSSESGHFHPLTYNPSSHTISSQHDGTLSSLIKSCGLLDILGEHHPQRPFPSTYSRGKKRLDYILVSSAIAHTVQKSGILPYHSIFQSDHRPCYIDIDANALFSESTVPIVPPCLRQLQLLDPRKVSKYKESVHKQLEYHNIIGKYRTLKDTAESADWAEHDTGD